MSRPVTPWAAVGLHAAAGSCLVGLASAAWMLARRWGDPVGCYLSGCPAEIAITTLIVAVAYLLGSMAAAAGLVVLQIRGARVRLRSIVALAAPPLLWPIALSLVS